MHNSYYIIALLLTSLSILFVTQYEQPITFKKGFTNDFQSYLDTFYPQFQFHRPDIENGSYGGAQNRPREAPERVPIVFIHGNSDIGVGDKELTFQTGYTKMIEYFHSQGYTSKDLYVTTWGNGNQALASLNYHSYEHLTFLRSFLEAVLNYTKSPYVNVIGHSMGVTLARKIIKGGIANDELIGGKYDLGEPLTKRIQVFVGLAGANYGLSSCYTSGTSLPTCGMTNGFFPGQPPFVSRSSFLEDLDNNRAKEGSWVVTGRSPYDEVIGGECIVWGKYTTRIKGQDEEFVMNSPTVGHFGMRDQTGPEIYQIFKQRQGVYVI